MEYLFVCLVFVNSLVICPLSGHYYYSNYFDDTKFINASGVAILGLLNCHSVSLSCYVL